MRGKGRGRGPVVVIGMAVCAALGGCAGPRTNLGARTGTCFKALPVAHAAVHGRGHLLGVRLSPVAKVARLAGELQGGGPVSPGSLPGRAGDPKRSLCVVAYRGQFGPGQVVNAQGAAGGRFAVVVVAPTGDGPVRSFVVSHLPIPFKRLA